MDKAMINRILEEKRDIMLNPVPGIAVTWPENNIRKWHVQIKPPEDSVYADDVFEMLIEFAPPYPIQAPRLKMLTPIFHPNIDTHYGVCVQSLRYNYSAELTIRQIFDEIMYSLSHPNPDDALHMEAAEVMKQSEELFNQRARQVVNQNLRNRIQ